MKTIEKWLKTLPKSLRDSALKQMDYFDKDKKVPTLSRAIVWFRVWWLTDEGKEFWNSFYEALLWAEQEDLKDGLKK